MTHRWPKVVFFNKLDVSALNHNDIVETSKFFQTQKNTRGTLFIKLAKSLAAISPEEKQSTYKIGS